MNIKQILMILLLAVLHYSSSTASDLPAISRNFDKHSISIFTDGTLIGQLADNASSAWALKLPTPLFSLANHGDIFITLTPSGRAVKVYNGATPLIKPLDTFVSSFVDEGYVDEECFASASTTHEALILDVTTGRVTDLRNPNHIILTNQRVNVTGHCAGQDFQSSASYLMINGRDARLTEPYIGHSSVVDSNFGLPDYLGHSVNTMISLPNKALIFDLFSGPVLMSNSSAIYSFMVSPSVTVPHSVQMALSNVEVEHLSKHFSYSQSMELLENAALIDADENGLFAVTAIMTSSPLDGIFIATLSAYGDYKLATLTSPGIAHVSVPNSQHSTFRRSTIRSAQYNTFNNPIVAGCIGGALTTIFLLGFYSRSELTNLADAIFQRILEIVTPKTKSSQPKPYVLIDFLQKVNNGSIVLSGNTANKMRRALRRKSYKVLNNEAVLITSMILGTGSNGTTVFTGIFGSRLVAIKRVLKDSICGSREVETLLKVEGHPNVIRYFTHSSDEHFSYIVVEYCPQQLNYDLCRDDTEAALRYGSQLLSGLIHLHRSKIIHRDLKPSNLLISLDDNLKISDYGISKAYSSSEVFLNTLSVAGTPGWAAPEMLVDGGCSYASDVFTSGCILHFMLTGHHPFGDELHRIANIINDKPELRVTDPLTINVINNMLSSKQEDRQLPEQLLFRCPLFWCWEDRLHYVLRLSDLLEFEENSAPICVKWENHCLKQQLFKQAEGDNLVWKVGDEPIGFLALLDDSILNSLLYRKYNPNSSKDLIRVIRNKWNHYRELDAYSKDLLGKTHRSFLNYFTERFPTLFSVIWDFCVKEDLNLIPNPKLIE